jgi:hypothetical protein
MAARIARLRRYLARGLRWLAGLVDDRRHWHSDDLPCRCGARQSVHRAAAAGGCTHCSCPGFRLDTAAADAPPRPEHRSDPSGHLARAEGDRIVPGGAVLNLGPPRPKPDYDPDQFVRWRPPRRSP